MLYQTDPTHTRQHHYHNTTSEHSQSRFSAFLPLPRALHLSPCIQKRRPVIYPNGFSRSEQTATRQKRLCHFPLIAICLVSILYHAYRGTAMAQSVQRLATGWKVRGLNPGGGRDFPQSSRPALRPTQSPIQRVPGSFPGDKAAGAWRLPPTTSSAEVKERVELYLYSPCSLRGLF